MKTKAFILLIVLLLPTAAHSQIPQWGIVSLCCAHVRTEPRHGAEMATQVIMGTPLKILAEQDTWYQIETPEGYRGWIHPLSVATQTTEGMQAWRDSYRYIYTLMQGYAYTAPDSTALPVTDLSLGCIVQSSGKRINGYIEIFTPDGRKGYVKKIGLSGLFSWSQQQPDMLRLEREARMMMGSTYLWGGTSTKGVDCSGLSKLLYFSQGIILQRDASQQARTGEELDTITTHNYRRGDLLFFGNAKGRINHVVIYLDKGEYIESAGRVKIGSLCPDSPLYEPKKILAARRIITATGATGIVRVSRHPWYFTLNDTEP